MIPSSPSSRRRLCSSTSNPNDEMIPSPVIATLCTVLLQPRRPTWSAVGWNVPAVSSGPPIELRVERPTTHLVPSGMALRLASGSKVCTAEEAVATIPDGACITVSGTITMLLPRTLLGALEARFLSEQPPAGPDVVRAVPDRRAGDRAAVVPRAAQAGDRRLVHAARAAAPDDRRRRGRGLPVPARQPELLVPGAWPPDATDTSRRSGIDTYLDPRHGGGKLNARTTEDLVSLATVDGEEHIVYPRLPHRRRPDPGVGRRRARQRQPRGRGGDDERAVPGAGGQALRRAGDRAGPAAGRGRPDPAAPRRRARHPRRRRRHQPGRGARGLDRHDELPAAGAPRAAAAVARARRHRSARSGGAG